MLNFNLRGIPPETMHILKEEAKKQDKSVNSIILHLINLELGFEPRKTPIYHDLDFLAGTWSELDQDEFKQHTSDFEAIDKDLWQ